MSTEELGRKLNEQSLESRTTGLAGLLVGMALKYGLPSVCCIWLFYVIWCKDQQLFQQTEKVTAALVESNHARADEAEAKNNTAAALNKLAEAVANKTR